MRSEDGWYFSFACGLRDGVGLSGTWKTDGVDVQIFVREGSGEPQELWKNTVANVGWENYIIDLSDYEDKVVDLVVEVSAGKVNNANFDWFVLAEPQLNNGFTSVLDVHDFAMNKETAVTVNGKITTLSREEFGSRAFRGTFASNAVTKDGIYIHPPYKNDVVGTMRVTLREVKVSVDQPKRSRGASGKAEHEL